MKTPKIPSQRFDSFKSESSQSDFSVPMALSILLIAIVLGILGGYLVVRFSPNQKVEVAEKSETTDQQSKKTVGAVKKNFKDKVEGSLREGGIDGEGNFYIERPGGVSQNAYVTSSTVDLSEFVGKKVRVWGETYQGEKVGWLMDVGLVEVLE